MNRFGKISHHISMKDVKKKHLEKIVARKIEEIRIEEERKLHNKIYDKCKSNWRDELEEGMTVAGSFLTTEPAEGDTDLSSVDVNNANSYINTITSSQGDSFLDPSGSSYKQGVGFFEDGVGFGPNGGFNFGSDYIGFAFPLTQGSPTFGRAEIKAQDLSSIDSIVANVIRGNSSNGGQPPLNVETKGLRIQYKIDGMDTFKELNVKPDGTTDSSVSNILIPGFGEGGTAFDTPNNVIVTIPEYVRTKTTQLRLITNDVGFHIAPVYGVNNFRFQRRAPINVFVSLDSPEATSFVRLGGKESDPKKRRKKVEDILRAGQQYTNKYLGNDFPGSFTELSPEMISPKTSSIEQEIADIQQQNRDSMSQQTKDRFQIPKQTKEFKQFSYVQQRYITKISDLFKNLPDIGLTNSQISNAFKSQEELSKLTSALNDAYNEKRTKIVGTLDNPPEKPPTKSQIDALNDELYRLMDFSNFASIAVSQGIAYNPFPPGHVLTPADVDAAQRIYGKGVDPQTEPVKDENPKGFLDLISDPAAKLMGYAPAKNAFDYYMNQLKSQNVPPGGEIKGEHNLTNMMDKKEMNLMKTMIDGVMSDPTLTTDIQREVELNKGYLNVRAASKNFKNITGFFDPTKNDGFKIDRGKDGVIKNIKIKKSYDFTDKGDTGGASIVSGRPAMSYAKFSGLNKYFKGGSESPTMNLEIDFGIPTISKTKSKRKYDEYGRLKESSSYKRIFNKIKKLDKT